MMNRDRYKFVVMASVAVLLACCKEPGPVDPPIPASNVFLMYDNIGDGGNDGGYFTVNVNAAGKAVAAGALREGQRVIVFHRKSYRNTDGDVIYELVKDTKAKAGFSRNILKTYGSGEISLNVETIRRVVGDVRTLAPADHYGLAFGSHGKGWIPKVNPAGLRRSADSASFVDLWTIPENPLTRYLASEKGERLDVGEFADALDEWDWDFILLDDCFMASVEALYEMRHLADYFIASPTEILSTGFPYDRVVSTLFDDWTNLAGVAAGFVEAYRTGEIGFAPCATVAVVKSSELEALALTVRAIRSDGTNDIDPTVSPAVQSYEGYYTHVFYDFDDYIGRWAKSRSLYDVFYDQLKKTVVFADHTDYYYSALTGGVSGRRPVTHYSGLNVFIPWSGWSLMIPDYQQTEWYKIVYAE